MRKDALAPTEIPPNTAQIIKRRLGPLERHYWMSQGHYSFMNALLSAYFQGFDDCVTVIAKEGVPQDHSFDPGI